MKWLHRNKSGQIIIFIIGAILIPNIIEEFVSRLFHLQFENEIWYEVVDTSIMLLVSLPIMWWLINVLDGYVGETEKVAVEREKTNDRFKQKNKELHRLAYYDELTDLPNRHLLEFDLENIIAMLPHNNDKKLIGVSLLGMDRFQRVNDTMGHRFGDALLLEVSNKIQEVLPKQFKLYRHTGDVFAIVGSLLDMSEYIKVKEIVMSLFEQPFNVLEEELYASLSAGITMYPDLGHDAETLLKQADQALSVAKLDGGRTYRMFDPILLACAVRKMKLENDLFKALENDELELHYQPQIDLVKNQIVGAEALIRWNHPELGLISPMEFIPIAEDTGAIIPIGAWVIETACRRLKIWQSKGYQLSIAVNVSIRQLRQYNFTDVVEQTLFKTGISPGDLDIEITETLMQDVGESERIFAELKQVGVNIAIDDFGTGYASLSVLGSLSIDYLKIDQAFIRQMTTNPKMYSIVKTIIQLGSNLGVKLVAEGIEETVHQDILRELNCEYGQGYLYSKPLKHTAFLKLLESERIKIS